jgi:tetratricopeptide (TPR) repeat protein
MLELLLRLLGLKRRRRRRVYVQPPLPPGVAPPRPRTASRAAMPAPPGTSQDAAAGQPGPNLRASAEVQTSEQAHALIRERRAREGGWLQRLPVVGEMLRPRRLRSRVPPLPAAVPGVAAPEARARKRPRKPLSVVLKDIGREAAQSWGGPVGGFARKLLFFGLVYVAPAVLVGVPGYIVLQEMRGIGVEVAPIAVPPAIEKTGRTPDVLAQLLIDQVESVRHEVILDRTDRWPQDVDGRPIPFALTSQADTLHRLAVFLRGLTPLPTRTLTGAVTLLPDDRLSFRIYMTGMNQGAPIASLDGFSADDLNRVVAGAAPLVLRAITPRLYAWFVARNEQRIDELQAALHRLLSEPATGVVDPATRDTVDFLIARNLSRAGRADEAVELADEMIKRSPRYPPGYFARALGQLSLNDIDGALASAQDARRMDGGNAWSYKVSARVLIAARRLGDALTDIRVARRLDPNDGSAIVIEADVLLNMRRIEEASNVVRIGMERTPGQPGILEAAAGVMLARGRPDIAIGLINNELRQRPDRVSALITKARLLSALGRGADALEAAEAAVRLQPTNGMAQTARAYALITAGRPTEALTTLNQLLETAPDNATIMQGQALALAAIGRKAEAIATYRRVLEIQPDFTAARRELERLEGTTPAAAPPATAAGAAPPARPSANGEFIAKPIDVGPAPVPIIPRAAPSQLPMLPGALLDRRNLPPSQFRRPDSDTP